ncbi:MAG: family 10 glycosylhydrolase [Rhodothermales bacterium]
MKRLLFATLLALATLPALAQDPPKHEFRGAWIATVINLDWPTSPSATTAQQQAQLIGILDALQGAGINAVVFQVRTESDAFYASETEPWSYWLTGEQGTAPDPFYDPLAFAIEEAHKRGMELHAWFNPYRAVRGSGYANSADHVSMEHPEWLLTFGNLQVLNPGLPEVREYVTDVIAEVAERYDIDGVHFDDYFYPYPPNQVTDEDADAFAADPRGFTNIGDWRRDNVNLLVASVNAAIQTANPDVVFGISPFGIWKNGVPAGTSGLDAYNVVYADALAWLDGGTIDYLAPQLYWSSQRSFDADGDGDLDFNLQRFSTLAPWWALQTAAAGRHLYPGLAAYRSGNPGYAPSEIPTQIRFTREAADMQGTILFRARAGILTSPGNLRDSLETDLYRHPALPPVMPWRSQAVPATPEELDYVFEGEDVTLAWTPPASSAADSARFFAVYRIQSATEPDYETALADARNLLAVTGETTFTDRPFNVGEPYYYVVTGVSANSIESAPSNAVVLEGVAIDTEDTAGPLAFELGSNYPNPFAARTTIGFSLDRPAAVTLRVYDMLGRTVATLVDDARYPAGSHTVEWDGISASGRRLSSGTYFYRLDADGRRAAKPMTLIR